MFANLRLTRPVHLAQEGCGFQNSATSFDPDFYAAGSYSLTRPLRTDRRLIRFWEMTARGWSGQSGGGVRGCDGVAVRCNARHNSAMTSRRCRPPRIGIRSVSRHGIERLIARTALESHLHSRRSIQRFELDTYHGDALPTELRGQVLTCLTRRFVPCGPDPVGCTAVVQGHSHHRPRRAQRVAGLLAPRPMAARPWPAPVDVRAMDACPWTRARGRVPVDARLAVPRQPHMSMATTLVPPRQCSAR